MTMQLRILGCAGGIGGGMRTASMLLNDNILIEAGTGVADLTLDEMAKVRHVFLTHAHLDHIAGLPLIFASVFDRIVGEEIVVYARRETLDALRAHIFNEVIWPDFTRLPDPGNPVLRFSECGPGETVCVGQMEFTAVDVSHSVPAQGYIIANADKVMAITGDTGSNDSVWGVLNDLDTLHSLLVEVSFPNDQAALAQASGHYCPQTMASDVRRLQHRPAIWLNSMKPGAESQIYREVCELLPDRNIQVLHQQSIFQL